MKTLMVWALGLMAGAALAADPKWIAGVVENNAGGIMSLTAIQDKDCTGDWFVLRSVTPSGLLTGCWKFLGETGLIALAWSDGSVTEGKVSAVHWSDWALAGIDDAPAAKPAEPSKPSAPAPRITPKKDDTIS